MTAVVAIEPTFAAWRDAARRLLATGIAPDRVTWSDASSAQMPLDAFAAEVPRVPAAAAQRPATQPAARVPSRFLAQAERAACFRDDERWALLYRLLWRLTHGEPHLLQVVVDPDVHRLTTMDKAIRRDVHKMHAFVRFRCVGAPDGDTYVAWFRPAHLIVEIATPFFARRFANMRWSILGPDRSAYWDGESLHFGAGVARSDAPPPDRLEALWRTYYAHTFNPARLKIGAMRAEMPKRYWADLPEAALIPDLVGDAPARVRAMLDRARRDEERRARESERELESDL